MGFASLIADGCPIRAGSGARACLAGRRGQPDHSAGLLHMQHRDTVLDGGGSDRLADDLVTHGSRQELRAAAARLCAPGARSVGRHTLGRAGFSGRLRRSRSDGTHLLTGISGPDYRKYSIIDDLPRRDRSTWLGR